MIYWWRRVISNKTELTAHTTLRFFTNDGSKCFGPGVVELFKLIEKHNSLRMAAKEMGMAYSKAWNIIRESEKALKVELLESKTGGKKGGGSHLTAEAQEILSAYITLQNKLLQTIESYKPDLPSFSLNTEEKISTSKSISLQEIPLNHHIFLTGEKQVGKSTLIKKVIETIAEEWLTKNFLDNSFTIKGFFSKMKEGVLEVSLYNSPLKSFLESVWIPQVVKQCAVKTEQKVTVDLQAFDEIGLFLSEKELCEKEQKLLAMDESGRFESDSVVFRKAVLDAIKNTIPILGVIRKLPYPSWLDQIVHSPNVTLLEITIENREEVFNKILQHYRIIFQL